MPKITALIHTLNDGLRLGRTLDSLRSVDQVIVVDHGSSDNTERVAQEHGAEFKQGIPGVDRGTYALDASNDWVLCLLADESISEQLEAAIFEWKAREHDQETGFNFRVREEDEKGWKIKQPETRLVNRRKINWMGELPPTATTNEVMAGDLLKFHSP